MLFYSQNLKMSWKFGTKPVLQLHVVSYPFFKGGHKSLKLKMAKQHVWPSKNLSGP